MSEPKAYRDDYRMVNGLLSMLAEIPFTMHGTTMIEIGAGLGESTRIFSTFFYHVITIDPIPDARAHEIFLRNTKGRNITHMRMTSDEAIADRFMPSYVGFVYVDGGHEYEQVKRDLRNYWPLVSEGGYLGGHDYGTPSEKNTRVTDAVNDVFGKPDMTFSDWSFLVKKVSGREINLTDTKA